MTTVTREDVLRYRVRVQPLDREGAHGDAAILDLGVQDSGSDGAGWSLAIRGADVPAADPVLAWTLRGAPRAYRRGEVAQAPREVVGSWRPRSKGKRIRLAVSLWDGSAIPAGVEPEAERLAAVRGQAFDGFSEE